MASPRLEIFHLAGSDGGFRFCILRRPPAHAGVRGAIVHVPAFGEEMNKTRHMVALQAQRLARDGWLVLQIDLLGTGDSSGDFGDATWQAWLADVALAVDHVRGLEVDTVWLWGLRFGGLLAAEATRSFGLDDCGLLLWQPVSSGKQHLQQFLRMWKTAQIVGKVVDVAKSPQQLLEAGLSAEVAGYVVSPALAAGMQAANLSAVRCGPGVRWIQVNAEGMSEPPPAFVRLEQAWKAAGQRVSFHAVEGPSFWQAQEITVVPALLEQTDRLMAGEGQALVAS